LGGSHPIDSLVFGYYQHSNKLKSVFDGRNDAQTTMGDFRTSALSPYHSKTDSATTDYVYDVNGNMTRDLNKDIGSSTADGITYNHLNLPWQIKVRSASGTKGTITYIYDATGNKLEKRTMDSVGNVQTHTAYIGSFQYQGKNTYAGSNPADTLLFFGDEEGRVRVVTDTTTGQPLTSFKYDYFIKDHLGNTRMVLTDEQESDKYIAATMEVADSAQENLYYSNLSNTRTDLPAGYPTDTTTNPNNKVARLNGGSAGPKIGPGITLKVMAGDQFSIRASSWYRLNGTNPGAPANPLTDVLASLISGVGNLPGGGHPSMSTLQTNSTPLSSNITEFLSDTGSSINSSKPHAFVNWVLFDNQFNYVAESSGFDQVGSDTILKKHVLMNLPVTKSGYLYIYLSNETPNIDVFFDNLQVTHTRGAMLEEDHYYPFGLTMAGISDKVLKAQYAKNNYRYNGKELQSKEFSDGTGLEEYDYGKRMYNSQIGRWMNEDPLSDNFNGETPYIYAGNDPVNKYVGGKFKFPVKDEARIKRDYPLFYKYIKSGIQDLLKSDRVVEAFMKYGNMNRATLMNEFKIGSGAEIIVKDLGGYHKGRTQREKSEHNIELDERFLKLLQKVKPDDKDAALLVAMFTLLHEEAHRGNLADHMDNPNRTTSEDGYSLVDEIYGPLAENGFINSTFQDKDWEQNLIKGARMVIDEKKTGINRKTYQQEIGTMQSNRSVICLLRTRILS